MEREIYIHLIQQLIFLKCWIFDHINIVTERFCLFAHRLMRVQELFMLGQSIYKLVHQELHIFVTFSHYCMRNSSSAARELQFYPHILTLPTAD